MQCIIYIQPIINSAFRHFTKSSVGSITQNSYFANSTWQLFVIDFFITKARKYWKNKIIKFTVKHPLLIWFYDMTFSGHCHCAYTVSHTWNQCVYSSWCSNFISRINGTDLSIFIILMVVLFLYLSVYLIQEFI